MAKQVASNQLEIDPGSPDPEEAVGLLLRDLRATPGGLSTAEAARRRLQYGPNELRRRSGVRWPAELATQLSHPLALLLWVAAALSFAVGSVAVGVAVLLVIFLNAVFALVQELQAERAVEALSDYLPPHATVLRDGKAQVVEAIGLVPGDIVLVEEGERIPADLRLLSGGVEVDTSTLTGESVPVVRSADLIDLDVPLLAARDLLFSGSDCTSGEARAVVYATGMHTELGRIAALSQRVKTEPSPLERQVRRVAWLIAAVAVGMAVAFLPLATFGAGLSIDNAVVFAIGLLAGNVPEGLLPVITLALAVAVRELASRGAVVKRLSAVETLGSTDVICTDKTGTLTENRMRPVSAWTWSSRIDLRDGSEATPHCDAAVDGMARAAVACNSARIEASGDHIGDPTEVALLLAGQALGISPDAERRERDRLALYHFDPRLKLMSTADADGSSVRLHTKGAPEAVLERCVTVVNADGGTIELGSDERELIAEQVRRFAADGLRVIALSQRQLGEGAPPERRELVERELCLLGLLTMEDPPRHEVAAAVAASHTAGIRILVITGDHPLTAAAIAHQVGIGGREHPRTVIADRLESMPEPELRDLLSTGEEIVFARANPEAKLHIAETLRSLGHVVAMTGDGVNDAPALRRADIGVAMGRSGTDVAREAATMVLSDDDFATIVVAIEAGRRVYDNVRKFIVYIFAHATPEVVPFLVFALAGGAVPLPLNVLQLLAFDVGSETLPSLALGRDPAEPGIMRRPPRPTDEGVIRGPMLVRAWLFLGVLVAGVSMAGFFFVLTSAGWHPGDPTGAGHPLHHAYLQATTMTFVGMIMGQIGTAFAVRTRRESLRSIGVFSNRYLLMAIAAELALAALFVYAPPFQALLGTASLPARDLLFLLPYPFIVWGADELRRWVLRRREGSRTRIPPAPRAARQAVVRTDRGG